MNLIIGIKSEGVVQRIFKDLSHRMGIRDTKIVLKMFIRNSWMITSEEPKQTKQDLVFSVKLHLRSYPWPLSLMPYAKALGCKFLSKCEKNHNSTNYNASLKVISGFETEIHTKKMPYILYGENILGWCYEQSKC